jgi:nitrite reductase/ring-hydroxylating ferredoxin subunit/uncharacterized membrane protein
MRSKASYNGHPIHPALIPFPFAFLVGAWLFDGAGWVLGRSSFWTTGSHLCAAGVVAALIAAVPGIIDYTYTVPPRSSAKKRATRHMLANLTAVAIFAVVWIVRGPAPSMALLGLELVGVALLAWSGWMGGVLVNRNQIGVDHRYADAGKWREATIHATPGQLTDVAADDELQTNQMKLLRLGDRRIVLARDEQGYVAFDDRCTHKGGSLAGGSLMCGTVQCPWHGSQFSVRTGHVSAGPARDPIGVLPVEVRDGRVFVRFST